MRPHLPHHTAATVVVVVAVIVVRMVVVVFILVVEAPSCFGVFCGGACYSNCGCNGHSCCG